MAGIYKTAKGQTIDMDRLRLQNETAIAVGNTGTNARGDQLGKGGVIIKTKAQIMQEYYASNMAVADSTPLDLSVTPAPTIQEDLPEEALADMTDQVEPVSEAAAPYIKPRGSLADTVAANTEVTQTLLVPPSKKHSGPQRL